MDKQSLFFTSIVAIVATALILMMLQFLANKLKIKTESEQTFNASYSIWISSILITFFIYLKVALELIENSIEVIISSKIIDNTFLAVMEKISIFIGFTYFFTFISYYIVHSIVKLSFGNRADSIEMEKDNKGYFIIKGMILILLVFSLQTIFEHFLGWFTIKIDTPFYH